MTNPSEKFDLNEGQNVAKMPVVEGITSVEHYADYFAKSFNDHGGVREFLKNLTEAPASEAYGKLSMLPATYERGIIEWPGIPPATLKKIASENFIVHAVIQQRLVDIEKYATPSTQIWKPGWKIEMTEALEEPTEEDRKSIKEATAFIENCNVESRSDVRLRDQKGYTGFREFLKTIVRDSYRYDLLAVWTDCDKDGKVKAFKALPASNIALCGATGFEGRKSVFAVGRDDAGGVLHKFSRNDLFTACRNPRSDPDCGNYGYSELEMALRILSAFSNAFDMNADIFTRSAVPNGFLQLKGMFNQKQVDALSRIWSNMRKGPSKQFSLPALNVPKDGEISVVDLSAMAGKDGLYRDYVNMMGGLFCAITCFPVHRLGYHISGSKDEEPDDKRGNDAGMKDTSDPALASLLDFLESKINEYLIWPRWPHLRLTFYGKNPKEDARAYEAKKNASTLREMRAMADMPRLTKGVTDPDAMKLMELMELAPVDPGMSGIFQAMASALLGQKNGDQGAGEEARIRPSRDPAEAEAHGAVSGVRRNSAAETSRAEAAKSTLPLYVSRDVENDDAQALRDWFHGQGVAETNADLHVTVAFSKRPVDWFAAGVAEVGLTIPPGGPRQMERFNGGAIVMRFASPALSARHQEFLDAGASYDFDYRPHVTICYDPEETIDISSIQPFQGPITFGPEIFKPIDENWKDKIETVPAKNTI